MFPARAGIDRTHLAGRTAATGRGTLDEARLLPASDKRERDVQKSLAKLAEHKGWYLFAAGQAYAMVNGKAPGKRNAEVMLVREVTRWRADVQRFVPDGLAGFEALIEDALAHPAPLPQRASEMKRNLVSR